MDHADVTQPTAAEKKLAAAKLLVEEAEARCAALVTHQRLIRGRATEVAAARKSLAVEGLLGKDQAAADRLTSLQQESGKLTAEAEDAASAVEEAEVEVGLASKAFADAVSAARWAEGHALIAELHNRGAGLDLRLAKLADDFKAFQELGHKIRLLTGAAQFGYVNSERNMRQCLSTAFLTPVSRLEVFAPHERRSMADWVGLRKVPMTNDEDTA